MAKLNILNWDASSSDLSDWTAYAGGSGKLARVSNANALNGYAFAAGRSSAPKSYQDLAIDPVDVSAIAADAADVVVTYRCSSYTDADLGSVGVEFLSSGSVIGSSYTTLADWTNTVFKTLSFRAAVPVGTDTIRLVFEGQRAAGTECSAYVDQFTADIFPRKTAHRYWRVWVDSVVSGTPAAAQEIEFYEAFEAINVATGGTASADTAYSGWDAANAFNGTVSGNGWATDGGSTPHWIQYDFGASNDKVITGLSWTARSDGWDNQSVVNGRMAYSDDGATWTDAFSFEMPSGDWASGVTQTYYDEIPLVIPRTKTSQVDEYVLQKIELTTPFARITQSPVLFMYSDTPFGRVTQSPVLVLAQDLPFARVTQGAALVLIGSLLPNKHYNIHRYLVRTYPSSGNSLMLESGDLMLTESGETIEV